MFWFGGRIFGTYLQLMAWAAGVIGTFVIVSQAGSNDAALAG